MLAMRNDSVVSARARRRHVGASIPAQRAGASIRKFLRSVTDLAMQVVGEHPPVVNAIHFRPGTLTRGDRILARFFEYLRGYPRCYPSAKFIR